MIVAFAHILVAYVVLVMPWIGRYKYQKLEQHLAARIPNARLRFYHLTVLQQWLLVAIVLLFAQLASVNWRSLGLMAPYSWAATEALLIMFAVALGLSVILFRYTGDRFLRRFLKMAGALIPATATERIWFAGVSLGAGVTEELLFRGFLLWYLSFFWPQLKLVPLIVISSLLFGFCHIYQGWMGIIGTSVLGAVLAWMYIATGSLVLPATIHALIDLRVLAILTPGRMGSLQRDTPRDQAQHMEKTGPSFRSG